MYQDKGGKGVQYLNPNAFALPDIGTGGNLGNGIVEGPPNWSLDVALSRDFQSAKAEGSNFGPSVQCANSLRTGVHSCRWTKPARAQLQQQYLWPAELNICDPRIIQFALNMCFSAMRTEKWGQVAETIEVESNVSSIFYVRN